MWIPAWLYRMLPLVYVLAGVACLARIDSRGLAILSAMPLFLAAVLTTYWRYEDRRQKLARRQRKARRRPTTGR